MKAAKQQTGVVPAAGTNLASMLAYAGALENQILVLAEEHHGEIDQHLDQLFADLNTAIAEKTDRYKYVMDRLETTASMLEARADQVYQAANALKTAKEHMKERIKASMAAAKLEELRGETWRFKLTPSKGSLVVDEAQAQKAEADIKAAIGAVLEHAEAYREKSRAGDPGGAGKELADLGAAVDHLQALEARTWKISVAIEKDMVRASVEAGQPVLGATIEPGYILRPYVNKTGVA